MAKSEEQPNLTVEQAADVELIQTAMKFLGGYLEAADRENSWKDDSGKSISDMFKLLGVEPLAVALVVAELVTQIEDQADEPCPLSYCAGFTAGLATGMNAESLRREREDEGDQA